MAPTPPSPTTPTTSYRARWQFLPWGFMAQYEFEAAISDDSLRAVTKLLLTTVLPQAARSHSTIIDLRGRDPQREALLGAAGLAAPLGEELFFLQGSRPPTPREELPDTEPLPEPFSIGYYTRFSHFEGPSHIAYSVQRVRQGLEESPLGELELILDPLTQISAVRLGVEVFEPRFLSIFGFSPVATQLVQIEAVPQALRLRLIGEALPRRDTFPIKSAALGDAVAQLLREIFNFDLRVDLQRGPAR